ncbi:unnamed protein product [Adineta steineri]|uniref:Poly [ADP-ribose] polymerase n=1 Tax=Adineta steineri TaxID=433720 RepID=A0A814TVN8_9BILA|nr:unnamed protein product [Adineta steineri]CAF4058695.1 unnamed protein product [Adineta steineri]
MGNSRSKCTETSVEKDQTTEVTAPSPTAQDDLILHSPVSKQPSSPRRSSMKPSIYVQKGDLASTKTDVIVVCSTSNFLRENILKLGGDAIQTSYNTQLKNNTTNSLITVATNGKFPSKQIYFLPCKCSEDENLLRDALKNFLATIIKAAVAANYQSIAFPAIGCGRMGCSVQSVAEIMVSEVRCQIKQYPISVSFIIQPEKQDIYDEFQKQINSDQPLRIKISNTRTISTSVRNATIEVTMGNITTQNVDVIVINSSAEILKETILNTAGDDIRQSFNAQIANNPNALLTVTSSGRLSCKQIFFVRWKPNVDESILRQSIVDFMWNVIQNILPHHYTSIAFPAIGCGKSACSVNIVVKTMVSEIKKEIQKRNLTLKVRFVIEPRQVNVYDEFCKQVLASEVDRSTTDDTLPSTWESPTGNKICFIVPKTSNECKTIATDFRRSMQGSDKEIIKIERIQNPRWYKQYLVHREDFRKTHGNDTEKVLYHGCPENAAYAIAADCFNRSFAGKNGTAYGVGVYFSSNAAYSHGYAHPNSKGERFMFIVRVLIGKTTAGNSSMKTRPVGFDSTTDGNHIFVTYHDAQAFAEYLITYK